MTGTDISGGELAGRSAYVTGGTRGIGRAIGETLARAGARVTVCGRTADMVARCNAETKAAGLSLEAEQVDVMDSEALRASIERTAERQGGLDILVVSAGKPSTGTAASTTLEAWDDCMAMNLRSAFVSSQAGLPHLVRSGRGSLVFVSSIWAVTAAPNKVAYTVAKASLTALMRALAADHAPDKVRVNAVAPGYIASDQLKNGLKSSYPGEELDVLIDEIAMKHPLRTIGQPQDIADAVTFLSGPRARFITGQTLVVDGGLASHFTVPLR